MSETISGPDATDAGGPSPSGPSLPVGGPPGASSPILAAIARAQAGAQPSAPGMGTAGGAIMQIKQGLDLIQQALPGLPLGSEIHRDAIRAVNTLSRHMPQGLPTAGVQQTGIQNLLRNTLRNALLQRLMGQQGGPQGPQPMQPSMPMPGA